jgi:hypothetical protein
MEHQGARGTQVFDPKWHSAVRDFEAMSGITCAECPPSWGNGGLNTSTNFSYGCGNKTVDTCFDPGSEFDTGKPSDERAMVFNLGDEIKLSQPELCVGASKCFVQYANVSELNTAFHAWLQQNGVTPTQAGCGDSLSACVYNKSLAMSKANAPLFYQSSRFSDWFGVFQSKFYNATQILRANQRRTGRLPQAHTCANFPREFLSTKFSTISSVFMNRKIVILLA